ncbi:MULTISPECIES: DUF1292 domain-containing protein [Bacillaceae]|uniref:DUF1292 domain-containing protein n=1 Tax=Bacillaceae TaxID=186817 RepID=UPI00047CE037|nr:MULTISPECIES: DUF1292 domain-containing protein [Bacillaceae]UOE95573.1 DUF1292 domain-containing protein [Alkalihalobacillus sp. LMS39]
MGQEEKDHIIIPDENGDEHLFEELFTFSVDETGKSYILLVPVGESEEDDDEEGTEVVAFRYEEKDEEDSDIALYPIETDEEWEMVEEMLNTFTENEMADDE